MLARHSLHVGGSKVCLLMAAGVPSRGFPKTLLLSYHLVGIESSMNQRKKQPEQTRKVILDAADHDFSLQGYSGSGLNGIISRAGLTKGALFHHFADKRALAKGWIEERLAPAIDALWIAPLDAVNSLDAFRKFCRERFTALRPDDAVSALSAVAAELAARDEMLGDALEAVFSIWRAAVAGLLERGKSTGWIHPSIQPANEAALIVSAFAGFSVTAQAARDPEVRRLAFTALDGYLETLRAQES